MIQLILIFLISIHNSSAFANALDTCELLKIHDVKIPESFRLINNTCSIITNLPECKNLYLEIANSGNDLKNYKPECSMNSDSISNVATNNLGYFYLGCYIGAFNETFGSLGSFLGESAAKIIVDIEANQICNSQVKYKRMLYESYNESSKAEFRIPIPSDNVLKNYSCETIRKAIFEEQRYRKVILQREGKRINTINNDGQSIEKLARKMLEQLGIELQCFNSQKQAELICGAATMMALTISPATALFKIKNIAGIDKVAKFESFAPLEKKLGTTQVLPTGILLNNKKLFPFGKIEEAFSKITLSKGRKWEILDPKNETELNEVFALYEKTYAQLGMVIDNSKKLASSRIVAIVRNEDGKISSYMLGRQDEFGFLVTQVGSDISREGLQVLSQTLKSEIPNGIYFQVSGHPLLSLKKANKAEVIPFEKVQKMREMQGRKISKPTQVELDEAVKRGDIPNDSLVINNAYYMTVMIDGEVKKVLKVMMGNPSL